MIKKNLFKRLMLISFSLLMLLGIMLNNRSMATENNYDATAPFGRIEVEGVKNSNNTNYVENQEIKVNVYAQDDKSSENEIEYFVSFSPIEKATKIEGWKNLAENPTCNLTLPNQTDSHNIYVAFKDASENVSIVSEAINQEITYNLNDGTYNGSTNDLTGIDTTRKYGAPFVITSRQPKKEGLYFIGWSTDQGSNVASYRAGDIIPADMVIAGNTLYAVYTTDKNKLPNLSDVVEIGEYVDYPVEYENPTGALLTGWRVLSKDVDIDGNAQKGTVNLISAGIPMTYYHSNDTKTSVENLAINFLDTTFGTTGNNEFRKNGFEEGKTLREIFSNQYTDKYKANTTVTYKTYEGNTVTGTKNAKDLKVRVMTKQDLDKVFKSTTEVGTTLTAEKFNYLLAVPATSEYASYYLTEGTDSSALWNVDADGKMNENNNIEDGIRVVVSLKPDVLATGKDPIGGWDIEVKVKDITYNIEYKTESGKTLGTDEITKPYETTNEVTAKEFTGYKLPASQNVEWDSEEPKTITFIYEPIEYKITINLDGGTGEENKTYTIESGDITLEEPTKEGHTFLGWTTENETTPNKEIIIPTGSTGNKEYTANWSVNSYTLTFNADGGTEVEAITQNYNTAITAPVVPTKLGHTFKAWVPEIPATMPATNQTHTATWSVNSYTISFETNGGSSIAPITQNYGTTVTAPANPSKTGYTFAGWSEEIPTTMPAENITIEASWTPNTNTKYTVYHYFENADDNGYSSYGEAIEKTGTTGASITLANEKISIAGGTYSKGSFTANGATATETTIKADGTTEIHLYYTRNKYTLTIEKDENVASVTGANTYKYGATVSISAVLSETEGYTTTFAGWTTTGTVSIKDATSANTTLTMPNGNVTIKATATKTANGGIKYKVYNYLENIEDSNYTQYGDVIERTGTTGASITLANEKISIAGGTYSKGSLTANGETATETTIKADGTTEIHLYYTRNTYTLTVAKDANIASVTGGGTYKYGKTVNIGATLGTVTGHTVTFKGWETEDNVTINNPTQINSSVIIPNENVTVKATTNKTANSYTITFETNGGSSIAPITQKYGTEVTAPANPSKEGYTFAGWNEAVPTTMPAEDMTIEANWTPNSNTKYTVYHYFENANDDGYMSYGNPIEKTGTTDSVITLANEITAVTGGTYSKGSLTEGGAAVATTTIKPDGTTEIHLYYKRNTYTLTIEKDENVASVTGANTYKYGQTVSISAVLGETLGYTYTFAGWTTTDTVSIKDATSANTTLTMPNGNVTIKATATKTANSGIKYKVYNYLENIDDDNYTQYGDVIERTGTTNEVLTLADEAIEITGGTYLKGKLTTTGDLVTTTTIKADGTTELHLYYERNEYTLTVEKDANIASVTGAGTYKYGKTVNIGATLGTATGYTVTFKGWTTEDNITIIDPTTRNASVIIPNSNVTVKATTNKTVNSYTISYTLNGGTNPSGAKTSYTIEDEVTLPTPTRNEYAFLGWFTSSTFSGTAVTKIAKGTTGNKTYYAKWESLVEAFAVYSEDDNSLRFYKNVPPTKGSQYNGKTVTEVYTGFEEIKVSGGIDSTSIYQPWNDICYNIVSVVFEDEISPTSTRYWFTDCDNTTSFDVTKLNTSRVTDMSDMFSGAGYNTSKITIIGLNNWDTSKVTDMSAMFSNFGYNADECNIGDISNWDTSNVTYMTGMFSSFAYNADECNIGNISNWNTSNVTNMAKMFYSAGYNSSPFSLDISEFDTTNVTIMTDMFTNMRKLQEITLGSKFKWVGTNGYLPAQSSDNIPGADGKWYNIATNVGYEPANVPSNTVATYSAIAPKEAFAVYSSGDNSLTFYKAAVPTKGSTYNNKIVTEVYTGFETATYASQSRVPWYENRKNITTVTVQDEIAPISTAFWFYEFENSSKFDVTNMNVSNVTNMKQMFYYGGYNTETFEIIGMNNWNTSKVTNMSYMFGSSGIIANIWNVGNLNNWNVSNVKDMSGMFDSSGMETLEWSIGDLSNWNVGNVTDMDSMFNLAASNTTSWDIGNLSNWNVSNVKDMSYIFCDTGDSATEWYIGNLSNWNVGNVTNMFGMFSGAGFSATTWDIGNLNTWNVSKVTDMGNMFSAAGAKAKTWNIGDLSNWNVSNVMDMSDMFGTTGTEATTWSVGDLSKWNVSNVENMWAMFRYSGQKTATWTVGDISEWDTSNVTNMSDMFIRAGYYSSTFTLDLSGWNTSKVNGMYGMFKETGYNATTWSVGNINTKTVNKTDGTTYTAWDTSNVTDMRAMFYNCKGLTSLDLSNWNISNVTKITMPNGATYYGMFQGCSNLTTLNISNWDTSNITSMKNMFNGCNKLQEITLGSKFKWVGTDGYLPAQTSDNIPGANGKWYNTATNVGYEPANVPSNTAATYSAIPIYEVRFEANGGNIDTLGSTYTTRYVTYGKTYGETTAEFPTAVRDGYEFLGWFTSATDGTEIKSTTTVTTTASGQTLYAQWEELLISIANEPLLGEGMKAVYWADENGNGETTASEYPEGSYNYAMGDGKTDSKDSKWANAITEEDGSYWVWIPRYAYKITNYTAPSKTPEAETLSKTKYGSIDVLFMYGTSDTHYRDEDGNAVALPEGYKVHPSFQAMETEADLATNPLGKWDKELEGIWVAKYEASRETSTDNWATYKNGGTSNTLTTNAGNTSTTLSRVVSKPSVISWRSIRQSYIYQNSLNMHPDLNSHEMKNSEWGAVAYLTHSSYGRNGNEIGVNQNSSYYTGGGPGTGTSTIYNSTYEYDESTFDETYDWNTTQGKLASTTGNIYGVYDIAGGAYEYVASYVNNGSSYITNGAYLGKLGTATDMKTKQVYASTVTDGSNSQAADYAANKNVYGDAVYETTTSASDANSWNNDSSNFPNSSSMSFARGGYYSYTDKAGVFDFDDANGYSDSAYGFRPVLCVERPVQTANAPVLGEGMKAVYWSDENASEEIIADEFTLSMYSYKKGDGTTDSKDSRWANAITEEDGSYWVWIPRYAYKITYYTDANKTTVSTNKTLYGDIDILFLKGTSNDEYYDEAGNILTGLPEGYKVHPSFQAMTTETDLATNPLGKWDKELEGIWVAKYEASRETSTDNWATYTNGGTSNTLTTNAGNTDATLSRVVSKPSVTSWRSISESNIYQNSLSMHLDLNSHEMKNSEWGAVAYLTHSSYGRNGNEIAVNQCTGYYTGGGPGTGSSTVYNSTYAYDATTFESTYAWNTTQGKLASTTGNIYGVYDMSGGSYEYTAAYVNNGNSSLTSYGANLVNATDLKTKQVYAVSNAGDSNSNNYSANSNVFGDAVYETSIDVNNNSDNWNSDYAFFPNMNIPFFMRGGNCNGTSNSGVFNFYGVLNGGGNASTSFRPVLCVTRPEALASKVKVGDYVNYPVEYTNVATSNDGSGNIPRDEFVGWRVLDVEGDTVKLVSAGVPLWYYHESDSDASIKALTTDFLTTSYLRSGFSESLSIIFNNNYTNNVRAMTKNDIDKVYDPTGATKTGFLTSIKNEKYEDLLAVPCKDETSEYAIYWLASGHDSDKDILWFVGYNGAISHDGWCNSGIRPVVTLKTGVTTTGQDANGVWQLE